MKALLQKALDLKALPVVLVLAAIARLAMYPFIGSMNPQSWEYEWIADQMLKGHGYSFPWGVHNGINYITPTAFMPPGQVLLDYIPLAIFGTGRLGHGVMFLEEVVLSWLLVWVGFKLLQALFKDERLAMLGAWFFALYPSFVITAGSFGVTAAVLLLDAALLLAIANYFVAVEERSSAIRPAIVVGLLAGLLTFFRSEAYIVLALTGVLVAIRLRRSLRGRAKEFAAMVLTALIVISPWIIRNYVTLNKVVIGSTSGGFNFWRGHNPDATGSSWKANGDGIWTTDAMYREFDSSVKYDPNIEQRYSDFHLQRALTWIRQHPSEEAVLAVKKPILLWGIDWYSAKAKTPGYILLYLVTVALAVFGWRRLRQTQSSLVLRASTTVIVSWLFLYTLIVIAFFTLPRFQVILIGIYFPLVVLGAKAVLERAGLWALTRDPKTTAPQALISEPAL